MNIGIGKDIKASLKGITLMIKIFRVEILDFKILQQINHANCSSLLNMCNLFNL